MPFTKVGPNKYRSPSGRTYTKAQVKLYYANGGHFPGETMASGMHKMPDGHMMRDSDMKGDRKKKPKRKRRRRRRRPPTGGIAEQAANSKKPRSISY
jgi:hypothetical protein